MRITNVITSPASAADEIQTELLRKSIHLLIALVPTLASFSVFITAALLGAGILVFTWAEVLRLAGKKVLVITSVTNGAARTRDKDRFVFGPVTLGLGAMLALMLYPEPAAAIGIYSLAFGDGLASLVGKLVPVGKIPGIEGKTLSGSYACFSAIYLSAYFVSGSIGTGLVIAVLGTFLEALPTRDMDNIIIPVGTGLAATLLLGLPF